MKAVLRRVLTFIAVFALLGGTMGQSVPAVSYGMAVGMPCDMTAMATPSGGAHSPIPCKAMTPDCLRHMGCATSPALPAPLLADSGHNRYRSVAYWTALPKLASLVREPEPLPPRTA